MKAHVLQRIEELITLGNSTVRSVSSQDYWMPDVVVAQSWMASAANAIQQVAPEGSFFRNELDRLMTNSDLKSVIRLSDKHSQPLISPLNIKIGKITLDGLNLALNKYLLPIRLPPKAFLVS